MLFCFLNAKTTASAKWHFYIFRDTIKKKKNNKVYLIIVMNASLVNVESLHWKKNKV